MKNSSKIIIVILLIIIVAVVLYFLPLKDKRNTVETSSLVTYQDAEKFYTFKYPSYAKIVESKNAISDTSVLLKGDFDIVFDVTTIPSNSFAELTAACNVNPYENIAKATSKVTFTEDTIEKNGNKFRHLSSKDTSSPASVSKEERYYIIKNNICYSIFTKIMNADKVEPQIVDDLESIFPTFKFTK